ncbi:hypothetical protein [Methylobacterium nodulans]|uniref:hypothetical protein n=1 Tax=Methylobacterium nodulans TaxID=114616 RepID=UPI0005C1ED25|nr:hypothetical protein [Methylobacterium nodulans]
MPRSHKPAGLAVDGAGILIREPCDLLPGRPQSRIAGREVAAMLKNVLLHYFDFAGRAGMTVL